MTDNTQPEALRTIKRFYRGTDCMAENQAGDWVRYEDHVAAATELRSQHARIAELEAELEAVGAGGVQALSAAPEAKKSALRTYPNPIVPLIKPVSEQEKMRALYLASSNLMAYLGRNGAIHSDGHAADVLMNCLNDLDGGEFDETLFAASPTPPAEQQAAPKAAPGEQFDSEGFRAWVLQNLPDDTIIGSSAWWADHLTTWAQRFVKAAPQQEAQEPVALLVRKNSWRAGQWEAAPPDSPSYGLAWANQRQYVYSSPQPAPAPHLLAADHKGMRVDYSGLLGQCRRALQSREPANAEMLRQLQGHLQELGRCWYAGDIVAVDEFLQLYCIEHEARAAIAAQGGKT